MANGPEVAEYPAHWEADVVLRDGAAAHLRPIREDDADRLQRMHQSQSESSIYLRYFTYKSTLTDRELRRFTGVDHQDRVSFVILLEDEIIGVGGYDRIDETAEAEVAFNISDAHQGRGLGSILLEHLAAAGRERGIEQFSAEVLPENRKMLTVFSEAGYEVQRKFEDGVVLLEFSIDPTQRSRAVMESREHRAEARSLRELLTPRHVAVIGASREYGSVGYQVLHNLTEGRFSGAVHSVNPEAFEIGGAPAYSTLSEIRESVDLAVIAVPAQQLAAVVTECGQHGVKGLLVLTGGLDPSPAAPAEPAEPAPDGSAAQAEPTPEDQEARVQEARAQGTREQGTPAQGTPAQGTPAQGTPAQGTPAQNARAQDTEAQQAEAQQAGAQEAGTQGGGRQEDGRQKAGAGSIDQRELVRLARRWGMRVIGPASVGLINTDPEILLNASLSPEMPMRGSVGLFSQSASIGVSLYAHAHRRRLGLSSVISAGNRADLSGNDAMQYFEDDEATSAVGIYLESFGNPRKFSRIARRLSRTKPVVVAKSDVMGRRLPPGHEVRTTRAPQGAVDAMLEHSGVIQVGNHDSLMDVLQVLATQPLPAGQRLGILSNSSSLARLLADAGEGRGLTVTSVHGSLDLEGTYRRASQQLREAVHQMLAAESVDALALCLQPRLDAEQRDFSAVISEAAAQYDKPVVVSVIGTLDPTAALNTVGDAAEVAEPGARQHGVPVFSSPARSIAALAKIVRYRRWREDDDGEPFVPAGLEGPHVARQADALLSTMLEGVEGASLRTLDAAQAHQLLGLYGIEVMPSLAFDTAEEAVEAAAQVGYPVAIKSTNVYLRHRLDLGGVQLNIPGPEALRDAVEDMGRRLAGYGSTGMEVQAMAPPGQGCVLRAIEDPLMGPVVSFGISGDAVDLLDDWAHAVPPMTDKDVRRLVRTPRAARKLSGYQGLPSVDMAAVEDLVQRVALLKDQHPEVASIALTPLLAAPDGVRVLQAVVQVGNPEQRTDSARRAMTRW